MGGVRHCKLVPVHVMGHGSWAVCVCVYLSSRVRVAAGGVWYRGVECVFVFRFRKVCEAWKIYNLLAFASG